MKVSRRIIQHRKSAPSILVQWFCCSILLFGNVLGMWFRAYFIFTGLKMLSMDSGSLFVWNTTDCYRINPNFEIFLEINLGMDPIIVVFLYCHDLQSKIFGGLPGSSDWILPTQRQTIESYPFSEIPFCFKVVLQGSGR